MAGSTIGTLFRVTTWGESHGPAVGCVVDGCPAGVSLSLEAIQEDMDRRRPGQSRITSQRRESDIVELLSGTLEGVTTGAPIAMMVRNEDARARDYEAMRDLFRPSHADYTYEAKYGIRDHRGGGRASYREAVGRVAAGAVARQMLAQWHGIEVVAYVAQVAEVHGDVDRDSVSRTEVDAQIVRCPDAVAAGKMVALIEAARRDGDSLGGVVEAIARGVPAGLGEPVFDKLTASLAGALMSLPAARGFEVGEGLGSVLMRGSTHNDPFVMKSGRVGTETNHSGGIQGGISNGEPLVLRVAFKPTATIMREQRTVSREGEPAMIKATGRHDPCVLPRAVAGVEAMVALVLADMALRQQAARIPSDR
ncbi:MAG: chorismate synthase [Armatimonadetes bacterium]|nr:chorismate synthase [Armatimonadota bacterium]MDE2206316.1 chorismate synthase [Armatimonadota bacterium]